MTDAIAGKNEKTELLHNSSTIPGLIAYGTGSKYAPYIDAFSTLGPTVTTSGGILSLVKDGVGLKSAFSKFSDNPSILNALGAVDQILDVKGFAVEAATLVNHFGNGGQTLRAQTLNYKLSYTIQGGDNLTSLAKRLNTTVETLVKQNNIKDKDNLQTGDKLTYTNKITDRVRMKKH